MDELSNIVKSHNGVIKSAHNTELMSYSYAINSRNNKKGYYALFLAEFEAKHVAELSRKFSIQNHVLRVAIMLKNPKKNSNGIFSVGNEEEQKNRKRIASYDDPNNLTKFLGECGKIDKRKQTVNKKTQHGIARKQHLVSKQIKLARFLALLPYVEE
jgi:ribosomal protein S18/ribosomal protein S6